MNKKLILFSLFLSIIYSVAPDERKTLLPNEEFTCITGNCENGKGKILYPNGDHYTGEFKNGLFHGNGTLTWAGPVPGNQATGRAKFKYIGAFKEGAPQGVFILTHSITNHWTEQEYIGELNNDFKRHNIDEIDLSKGGIWENGIVLKELSQVEVYTYLKQKYPESKVLENLIKQ